MPADESSAEGMGTDKVLGDALHSNDIRHSHHETFEKETEAGSIR